MNCNIIRDLIPLYIDECCSEEAANEVEKHLENCTHCKAVFEEMSTPPATETVSAPEKPLTRINDWKASVMQSALFLLSFLVITVGVALESRTPSGFSNGFWGINFVCPATGFMFSLPNWYFIKFYKDKKSFSRWTCAITFVLILAATTWTLFHYEYFVIDSGFVEFLKSCFALGKFMLFIYPYHGIFTAVLVLLSKILSSKYADFLGKE